MRQLLFLILLILSQASFAACTLSIYAAEHVSSISEIVVQRDIPVGSVIKSIKTTPTGTANVVVCKRTGNLFYDMKLSARQVFDNIYETNVPGVGIKIESPGGRTFDSPANKVDYTGQAGFSDTAPYTITFYKTGDITSGKIASGLAGEIYGDDSLPGLDIFLDSETTVTQLACSVGSGNLSFPMGNVPASDFSGPGTFSTKTVTTNLQLECDAGVNINVTLEGKQNADMPDNASVLALTSEAQTAGGVGVQVLYNDVPLKLNELLHLKSAGGGEELFPITVRYIQTAATLSGGAANAVATLNLTYQ